MFRAYIFTTAVTYVTTWKKGVAGKLYVYCGLGIGQKVYFIETRCAVTIGIIQGFKRKSVRADMLFN